eukprot:1390377-Pyramimonas_sp.AAC.1
MEPAGGWRPIGLLVSLFGLWGRCRRARAQQWELAHMRPHFAGSKFAAACDAAWRRAFRSEVGTSKGEESATPLWDMTKFYETSQLDRLLYQCKECGLPMAIAQ